MRNLHVVHRQNEATCIIELHRPQIYHMPMAGEIS